MQQEKGPATIVAEIELLIEHSHLTAKQMFDYADALRLVGRRVRALEVYASIDKNQVPESKRWLIALYVGQTLHDSGKFGEAVVSFRLAAELNPVSTVPRVYWANSLTYQEQFREALEVLQHATTLEGDIDEVLLNIALNYRALGMLTLAREYSERALAMTPDYDDAQLVLDDVTQALASKIE